jgi:predicted dehydrogenase/threonine dehydrogenase-like Zn-dependent dehydrogenase
MKQIVQNPKSGKLELLEVPAPSPGRGELLVRNHFSVVSPGTEKMAIDFARKSMLGKARSRPDLVSQVLRKVRQEGPLPTYRAVMNRLDAPQPLGYATAGVVEAVGADVVGFTPGDRVACAGAGYANHAEWIVVPENLAARVPEALALEKAAFATLGAIALQGLRVGEPQLGEVVAVIGLGLLGQLTVQFLVANGCQVLGVDLDPERVKQALGLGARWGAAPGDDHDAWKLAATEGHGADLAVVTAASESSQPIDLAARLCRAKGRVVAVGATAMELDRRAFYEKELELRMSMSYGPGRYDRRYEEEGLDYPRSYVRWTENRNLQAYLDLAARDRIDPQKMDVSEVPFADALASYEALARGERGGLAIIFRYDAEVSPAKTLPLAAAPSAVGGGAGVAFLGAGNYAKAVLLPALEAVPGVERRHIVTATGASARHTAEKFGFASCGTDLEVVLDDPAVGLVFIATRHDSHAELACRALRGGKAVWLEKPVALDEASLAQVIDTARETGGFLTVGYNRRFSPHAEAVREVFAARRGPLAIHYVVAAGAAPSGTWLMDPQVGGGRIVGEACHFVDLCGFLVGDNPSSIYARRLSSNAERDDSHLLVLGYDDGSTAAIEYLANTSDSLPKERIEISGDGKTARCENFRTTELPGRKPLKTLNQDKGQRAAVASVLGALRSGEGAPFDLEALRITSLATLRVAASVATARAVSLRD